MVIRTVLLGGMIALSASAVIAAEKPIRFWNLTSETVTSLRLAASGAKSFGVDLAKSDSDGSVDHDERLAIKNIAPGIYDASIGFKSGRSCIVSDLRIEANSVFSIEDKDLTSCKK